MIMDHRRGFGSFFRDKRQEAGLSIRQLCQLIDISMAYWSRIEREIEKPPRDELIERCAKQFSVPTDLAFGLAQRLPPDLRGQMPAVVAAYREFQRSRQTKTSSTESPEPGANASVSAPTPPVP